MPIPPKDGLHDIAPEATRQASCVMPCTRGPLTDRLHFLCQQQRAAADARSSCGSLHSSMSAAHDDHVELPAAAQPAQQLPADGESSARVELTGRSQRQRRHVPQRDCSDQSADALSECQCLRQLHLQLPLHGALHAQPSSVAATARSLLAVKVFASACCHCRWQQAIHCASRKSDTFPACVFSCSIYFDCPC